MMANDPFWCIVHSRFHFKIWDSSFIYFFHQMNISATNIQVFDESFPSIFNSFKLAAHWIRLKLITETIITLVRFAFDQGVAFSFKFCLTLLSPGHFQSTFCDIREISHQNNELLLHTLPYRIITWSKSNWNELKQSKSTNNVKLELHPSDLSRNNFNFSMGWKSNCLLNRTKPYRVKYSIEWNDLW